LKEKRDVHFLLKKMTSDCGATLDFEETLKMVRKTACII
jgi:hypothetical protein